MDRCDGYRLTVGVPADVEGDGKMTYFEDRRRYGSCFREGDVVLFVNFSGSYLHSFRMREGGGRQYTKCGYLVWDSCVHCDGAYY